MNENCCCKKVPVHVRFQRWMSDVKQRRIRNNIEHHFRYIRNLEKDSNYIKYANSELDRFMPVNTNNKTTNAMNDLMRKDIIDILALLGTQGDSGTSIHWKLWTLNKLTSFRPLTPLTFEDDEFNLVDEYGHINNTKSYQNRRVSDVFKRIDKDGNVQYIYYGGITRQDKYKVIKDGDYGGYNIKEINDPASWSGGAFIIKKDGTLSWSPLSAIIKDTKTFDPDTKFKVPAYTIEYPEGWWMSFVKEEDLEEVLKVYDIRYYTEEETKERLEDEVEIKRGKYKDEIMGYVNYLLSSITPWKSTKNHIIKKPLKNYVIDEQQKVKKPSGKKNRKGQDLRVPDEGTGVQ